MAPPPSPAQQTVDRINQRVGRIGVAPLKRPGAPVFRGGNGFGLDAALKGGATRTGSGGSTTGGDGEYQFEVDTGRGKLERTLARVTREIDEAEATGTLSSKEADKARGKAAKITEGLTDPLPEQDTTSAPAEHHKRSLLGHLADTVLGAPGAKHALGAVASHTATDARTGKKSAVGRVVAGGENVLTQALRQASRPSQAVLNAVVEANKEGEEDPFSIGPVHINRALLGMPGKGISPKKILTRAAQGWLLDPEHLASPGDLSNDAADAREARGEGRGFFGTHHGDVSNSPIINNPAVDLGIRTVTDPLSYIGFGTGAAGKGALAAADNIIPGIAAELREGGLRGISAAARTTLEKELPEEAMRLLETAEGGIRVRAPFGKWNEGKSVVAGRTLSAPVRELLESGPVTALRESGLGEAVGRASSAAHTAFQPRAAVRKLGDRAERAFDDARVDLTAGAPGRTQRQIDAVVGVARNIDDLTKDEVLQVGRALDLGGHIDDLPERLQPLGKAFEDWRGDFTNEQVANGVLIGPDARMEGLGRARDAKAAARERLGARLDDLNARESERIGRFEPADAGTAVGRTPDRLRDAGYRGGASDVRASGATKARDAALRDAEAAAEGQTAALGRGLVEGDAVQAVDDLPTLTGQTGKPIPPELRARVEAALKNARRDDAQIGAETRPLAHDEVRATRAADRARVGQAREAVRAEQAADKATQAADELLDRTTRLSDRSFDRGQRSVNAVQAIRKAKIAVERQIREADGALAEAEAAFARGVVADEDYFPRILTPEAIQFMKGSETGVTPAVSGVESVKSAITGDKFVTARKAEWADKTIDQINAEMAPLLENARAAGAIKADGPLEFFDSNPFTAFAQRDVTARRHIVGKQFYERLTQLSDDAGAPLARALDPHELELVAQADNLPRGTAGARERLAHELTGDHDWQLMDVPAVGVGTGKQTLLVRNEIADDMGRMQAAFAQPDKVMHFLDQWQGLWKSYATVPLPFGLGFHLRNAQGNVFLNWMAGMSEMRPYLDSFRMQRAVSKGITQFGDPFRFLSETDSTLVREALDRGVIGDGFFDIEVGRNGERAVENSHGKAAYKGAGRGWNAANPLSTDFALIEQGRKLGSGVENNARLAHFIWKHAQLGDFDEAARSVRRTLFDYSDVTPFERTYIKRLVPFYTFMRKSAPVVAEGFLTNPSKLSRIQQVRMELAEGTPDPGGLYPGFLTKGAAVPLPLGVSRALSHIPGLGANPNESMAFMPDLPLLSTADNLSDLLAIVDGIVPGSHSHETPTEGAQGLLGLLGGGAPGALSAGFQAAAGGRLFGGSSLSDRNVNASLPERLFGPLFTRNRDVDGDGKTEPSTTSKLDFLFESLFPLASKVPFGTKGEEDKSTRRILSTTTGLRLYPLGQATQDAEAWQRRDALIRLLESLYASGKVHEGDDSEDDQ